MHRVPAPAPGDVDSWRHLARALLLAGVPPGDVDWTTGGDLFGAADPLPPPRPDAKAPKVPRGFADLAAAVLCHSDPRRFPLLYRLLWRLQGDPGLLQFAPDPDARDAVMMEKAIRRDSHKMTAFVRFREVAMTGNRRRFVAWFEPDHHIVARTAPFFARRFGDMDWIILTPRGSAAFLDGALHVDPRPADRPAITDETEALWTTYYAAIFNPARLKVAAMLSEMPRKYWRNLPEATLIPDLIAGAAARVGEMRVDTRPPPAFHDRLGARRRDPDGT